MTGRFDRHRAPQRRATVADWIAALEAAERLHRAALSEAGSAVLQGGALSELTAFFARVRELSAESFPAQSDHARAAAGAFLNAARAFAHPATSPEARTACAAMLREAARYVDRLLTLWRTAQAQGSWGRYAGGGE